MAVTDTSDQPGVSSTSPPTEPFVPITSRAWWHRNLEPEERRRVMDELAITRVEHWVWRFTIMLTLSVIVAVMGLSADSAAVVIGAMLLAPLMQPVLATAACLSMSLLRKSLASLLKVALATAWCIGIAYLISTILPDGPLSGEVEARTRPDIRDLVVALAAGAAGAYATVRKDASSSLPGVAVAVALVPPLATIGITLEAQKPTLAIGASLLYFTNLAAIVFAGVMVFIATGFVPPRRLANTAVQLLVAGVIALAVVVAVSVPLYNRSAEAVEAVEDELRAKSIVEEWAKPLDLQWEVDVGEDRITVQLRGFGDPPDDGPLRVQLQQAFGDDLTVNVQYVRIERATTTTALPPSAEEELLVVVEPVVDEWLDDSDGADYEREGLRIVDGQVVVYVTGSGDPPSADDLDLALKDADLPTDLSVRVNWTPRETITTTPEETPIDLVTARLDPVIAEWALRYEVEVTMFSFDGERVIIEALGPTAPPINVLVDDVQEIVGDLNSGPVPVDVLFTQRRLLTTTIVAVDIFGGNVPGPTTTTTQGGPAPTSGG
jgi:uncharacterized hydrophobic protein (TIGR00271 family)